MAGRSGWSLSLAALPLGAWGVASCVVTTKSTMVETGAPYVEGDADTDTDTDTDTDADVDTGPGPVTTIPGLTSIYDVQNGLVAITNEVTVEGIVTAVAYNGFYLQDPAGGPRSGLWISAGPDWQVVYTPALVGDQLQVSGQYLELLELSQLDLTTSANPRILNFGQQVPLEPETLTLDQISEDWEGVLIRVEDVTVANPDLGFGEFSVQDEAGNLLLVDNQLHWYELAAEGTMPIGHAFASITGPLNESFGAYKLEPRNEHDLRLPGEETADTGAVPTGETGLLETGDTGLLDTGLPDTGETGQPETGDTGLDLPVAIEALNQGEVAEDTEVRIVDAVVTASGPLGLFVQSEASGEYSGLYVLLGNDWVSTWGAVAPGDRLQLEGRYTEAFGLTTLDLSTSLAPSLVVTSQGPVPEAVLQSAAVLGDPATAEPWEAVLVQVEAVTVDNPSLGFNEFSVVDAVPSTPLVVDDLLYLYPGLGTLQSGDSFSLIRGPLYSAFGAFRLVPRDASDLLP